MRREDQKSLSQKTKEQKKKIKKKIYFTVEVQFGHFVAFSGMFEMQ